MKLRRDAIANKILHVMGKLLDPPCSKSPSPLPSPSVTDQHEGNSERPTLSIKVTNPGAPALPTRPALSPFDACLQPIELHEWGRPSPDSRLLQSLSLRSISELDFRIPPSSRQFRAIENSSSLRSSSKTVLVAPHISAVIYYRKLRFSEASRMVDMPDESTAHVSRTGISSTNAIWL